ncbi:cyclopropyl isomerase [Prunus dulcis]|uniref:Cyclopropyl isomerase n=1 Tax=Prunus dulcis TaxID=3755 RepID=A0A4Y1RHJ6_PRUDU|nr:cyclopropyl isomerase [Prunus dulcis]
MGAPNPSKRWGEVFFLLYTPFWLTLCLGIVVPLKLYEVRFRYRLIVSTIKFDLRLWQSFTELEYLLIGLVSAVPAFLLPMLFVGKINKFNLVQILLENGVPE